MFSTFFTLAGGISAKQGANGATVFAMYEVTNMLCLSLTCCQVLFLTPEPNGVGECVYGIGRVLRRRRRRDGFNVGTP